VARQRLGGHRAAPDDAPREEESRPAISLDGKTVAYTATYERPAEVYTLPLDGGVPIRRTHDASRASVVGWTPSGEILCATRRYSTLPNTQLEPAVRHLQALITTKPVPVPRTPPYPVKT
jgi:hypothetical protein